MFRPLSCFLVTLFFALTYAARDDEKHGKDDHATDPGLETFVTRPDLRAPKWNITTYDGKLSPGYWFVSPYVNLNGKDANESWVGPYIYDGAGELVWSGGLMYSNLSQDFRLSNVNGEDALTLVVAGEAVVLNTNYTVRERYIPEPDGLRLNDHEFNFVDNGTRVLLIEKPASESMPTKAESKEIGFDGKCNAQFQGFAELDVTREGWPFSYRWNSYGRVALDESTLDDEPVNERCKGWDNTHANSVDKTSEGNYVLSCRHTDTIYHIDAATGDILWRLGGKKSDFKLGKHVEFSRQHNIRFARSEGSKMWITLLDNAKGQDTQEPTYKMSRGLRLVLDTDTMTAEVDLEIEHPDGKNNYAFRRGNYQVLPNGNIFMGWSEHAIMSEHAADGQLLMRASLESMWLGTYRAYKFPFVGAPVTEPDVVAIATTRSNRTETDIWASWNGATEVASWNVHAAFEDSDRPGELIANEKRSGFETKITFEAFPQYVILAAVDKEGTVLGQSAAVKTRIDKDADPTMLVESVYDQMYDDADEDEDDSEEDDDSYSYPSATQLAAVVAVAVVGYVFVAFIVMQRWPGVANMWPFRKRKGWMGNTPRIVVEHELDERDEDGEGNQGPRDPLLERGEKDW